MLQYTIVSFTIYKYCVSSFQVRDCNETSTHLWALTFIKMCTGKSYCTMGYHFYSNQYPTNYDNTRMFSY